LVECALEAGASGARLTGAGFGGCAVALCAAREAGALVARLEERFYRPRGARPEVLVARASDGARIVE
jgi:galactokinase